VPQQPWRDSRYVYLIASSGESYRLILDTWRGLNAVSALAGATLNIRTLYPDAKPIVELGSEQSRDRFNEKPGPKFIILRWAGADQPSEAIDEIG
jgi:hypothetical protein